MEHDNPLRYYGQMCLRHPEFKGERRKASRECLGCQRDRKKKWAKTFDAKAARTEREVLVRDDIRHARAMVKAIESKIRTRQIKIQVELGTYTVDHNTYRLRAIEELRAEGLIV